MIIFYYGVGCRQLPRLIIAAPLAVASFGLVLLAIAARVASAEPVQSGPRHPRITPGPVIDGWTGLPIPCRCLYQGNAYKPGEMVCMNTHLGTVMTRCEMFMNNTAWMPTSEPCLISGSMRGAVASLPDGSD
jgi:hypothetical protein